MKKFINNLLFKIMLKTFPLIKYYPFKWFSPVVNKLGNWIMQKRFPTPKVQPAAPEQPSAQPAPPAEEPKA